MRTSTALTSSTCDPKSGVFACWQSFPECGRSRANRLGGGSVTATSTSLCGWQRMTARTDSSSVTARVITNVL